MVEKGRKATEDLFCTKECQLRHREDVLQLGSWWGQGKRGWGMGVGMGACLTYNIHFMRF